MGKYNVLIIADTHCPAMYSRYPEFLQSIYDYWRCNKVVMIGDLVDYAAISYHTKETFMPSIEHELELARTQVKELSDRFPKCDWLLGNHDSLPTRRLADIGIPEKMLRDPRDILGLPKTWKVHPRYHKLIIDGAALMHGDQGKSSQTNAAFANAQAYFQSVIAGHHHSQGGVVYGANSNARYFGLQVGAGTDPKSPHLYYSRAYAQRPVLGCGVSLEGREAHFLPMYLEKWK